MLLLVMFFHFAEIWIVSETKFDMSASVLGVSAYVFKCLTLITKVIKNYLCRPSV